MYMSSQLPVTVVPRPWNKPPFRSKENNECAPETVSTLWKRGKSNVSAGIQTKYQKYKHPKLIMESEHLVKKLK
jgi:hypothetical protein